MSASTPAGKLRAVVDTNLFVSGLISPTGLPARLIDAILTRSFILVNSTDLQNEVTRVLARPSLTERYQIDPTTKQSLLDRLATAERAAPCEPLPLHARDPMDDKVLAAGLGAYVDYIVTGDNDLLALDGQPALGKLRIVTAGQFLDILAQRKEAGI